MFSPRKFSLIWTYPYSSISMLAMVPQYSLMFSDPFLSLLLPMNELWSTLVTQASRFTSGSSWFQNTLITPTLQPFLNPTIFFTPTYSLRPNDSRNRRSTRSRPLLSVNHIFRVFCTSDHLLSCSNCKCITLGRTHQEYPCEEARY